MSNDGVIILGDLGGTNLRLARRGASGPQDVRSYEIREWESLSAALRDYMPDAAGARFVLSFAKKYNPEGIYRFERSYKDVPWEFSVADLVRDHGLSAVEVVHDFYAMAMAVFDARPGIFVPVFPGRETDRMRAIIGVGTGLGHALIDPRTGRVYDTFGGHMPPCAVNAAQQEMLDALRAANTGERTFIFEDVLSGRGLAAMYRICGGTAADIAHAPDDAPLRTAARIFSEFLGLYANVVCLAGHGFGGLYLSGGVVEKLHGRGLLDWQAFRAAFIQRMVPIVDEALRETPVFRAGAEHTALYGLDVHVRGAR